MKGRESFRLRKRLPISFIVVQCETVTQRIDRSVAIASSM